MIHYEIDHRARLIYFSGVFLKKNYDDNNKKYWNQLKGRLYSKFSASKVQEFSIIGLYNFFSLFLTIAITVDTENVVIIHYYGMLFTINIISQYYFSVHCNV